MEKSLKIAKEAGKSHCIGNDVSSIKNVRSKFVFRAARNCVFHPVGLTNHP